MRAVAAGKAAVGMARGVDDVLGARLLDGMMTAGADTGPMSRWRLQAGTHPHPSAASEAAGRNALALADASRQDGGLLLVCLSGGASAMLAVPAAGLTIADQAGTTTCLLRAGLDIGAVNVVRRHLSAIKGGQLAARAGRSLTLAISDVCTPVEDDPAVIGSGPTAGDPSSFADALDIVVRHGLEREIPAAALRHLENGAAGRVDGPVPPGDPALQQAAYWIVASRHDAMRAAGLAANRLGYHVTTIAEPTVGAARRAPEALIARARALDRPACLVASGETTVQVRGNGRGGRNQELALAALAELAGIGPAMLASLGTDGVDGPTDAAGAIVDSAMWSALGPGAGATVTRALADNDSYPVLDALGALVRSGPTGTNVGDLQILLLGA